MKYASGFFLDVDNDINRKSSIVLNLRLCVGSPRPETHTRTFDSFKDFVKGKSSIPVDQIQNNTRHYIVKQMEQVPTMEVNLPKVNFVFSTLHSKAIIFRFNGYSSLNLKHYTSGFFHPRHQTAIYVRKVSS